jgi:hypothetical protein
MYVCMYVDADEDAILAACGAVMYSCFCAHVRKRLQYTCIHINAHTYEVDFLEKCVVVVCTLIFVCMRKCAHE